MTEAATLSLRLLEALLFASAAPLDASQLAARLPEGTELESLLAELTALYAPRGVNLVRVAGGWAFRTAPDLAARLKVEANQPRKLSRAAVETLAIIAYHQPVTRAGVEEIRGVALSKGTLDVLFEQGWIRPRGRSKSPGKPLLWGTSQSFLDHFGLNSLKDLPGMDELTAAGLLDPRPAITAYGAKGDGSGPEEQAHPQEDLFPPLESEDDPGENAR